MQTVAHAGPRTLVRRTTPWRAAAPSLLLLLLAGCGGGGFEVLGNSASLSASSASSHAANATLVAADAAAALDEAVLAAQEAAVQARGTGPATAQPGTAMVQQATPQAVVNVPIDCAASGTALLSISGGTPASNFNGQLDATEVYQVIFSNCRGSSNGAAVTGSLTLTVLNADSGTLGTALSASNLLVALPRGSLVLDGEITRQTTRTAGTGSSAGNVQFSSRFVTPRLTANTRYNGRTNSFTLSGLDLTRHSNWLNGVLLSSTLSGSHTLAATLSGLNFTHSVSTDGSVAHAATGLPLSGRWVAILANARLGITVLNAVATVTVDQGSNGSIDDTHAFPVSRLRDDAG